MALSAIGGWNGLSAHFVSKPADAGFVSITGIGFSGIVDYLILLVPPFIVSPGLVQKIYGACSEKAVRWRTAFNGLVMLIFW